jgi:hypothetical protein
LLWLSALSRVDEGLVNIHKRYLIFKRQPMKSVPFFKQSALLKPAVWGLYDVLPLKNLSRLRLLPFVKGALANPKIPHDIFGLAATLVLLYGLDDLSLIESACFHYPKNQKIILLTLYDLWGEYKGSFDY